MTHQNHQTNGASLEDCHTNFFALTELCGIKWRKLVWGESSGAGAPLEDPVISSYVRCLAGDILCVWRRVAAPSPPAPDPYDMAPPPPPQPPPLSLRAAKELWIFWYGDEPNLSGLVSPELISSQSEQGSWESGLSYECRSLLFKALHNLIERCLLSRDFVRLGKWFVQPYDGDEEDAGKNAWHLSFSFAFFVHGESTVCASVDVRQHPPVRTLTAARLAATAERARDAPRTKVILAPFGLEARLIGVVGTATSSPNGSNVAESWRSLYPLDATPTLVEVSVGGARMLYPQKYVLLTDLDEQPGHTAPKTHGLAERIARNAQQLLTQHMDVDGQEKTVEYVEPWRGASCTCTRVSACSPGSCAASPAPPSAPSPPAAPPTPHQSGPGSVSVPAALSTPAPTPDPHPPTKLTHYQNTMESPSQQLLNGVNNNNNNNNCNNKDTSNNIINILKRPTLSLAERDTDLLDDEHTLYTLYDYAAMNAWLEHPVKRFKTEERFHEETVSTNPRDLYATNHQHLIKNENTPHYDDPKDVKTNLFTSDGLHPSIRDLDQIFDNSDDAASGDETVRINGVNAGGGGGKGNNSMSGEERRPRAEELSKMFPTPPSLEPHAQPSPLHDHDHTTTPVATQLHDQQEDWSYVFKPPKICKYVGADSYAPVTLPSQQLPPLPPHAIYRPRWDSNEQSNNNRQMHRPPPNPNSAVSADTASAPPSVVSGIGANNSAGGGVGLGLPSSAQGSPSSPVNSPQACPVLLNVLLADTVLNIFRDHNFDSCTLCVCNASPKVVGNIRGADSGVYLNGSGNIESPCESPPASPIPPLYDDDTLMCTCGFSAIVNRRLAHRAGLFYEDEFEITGLVEEPNGSEPTMLAPIADVLLDQCRAPGGTCSALALAARRVAAPRQRDELQMNLLEYSDGGQAAALALRAAGSKEATPAVHRWPFIGARGPGSSRDVLLLMRKLRPLLQDAIQKRCCGTRMWDGVTGPLTWRQFHRLAGRGTEDLCEPQPVPALMVGHERDWLSLSPYALRHWERLALEPYSHQRDVVYVMLAPDGDALTEPLRVFVRELSHVYEACRLGRHTPLWRIAGSDGIMRAPVCEDVPLEDEWAGPLPSGRAGCVIRAYADTIRKVLMPQFASLTLDSSLCEPEISNKSMLHMERPSPSPMRPPSTPDHPPTPSSQSDQESESATSNNPSNNSGSGLGNSGTTSSSTQSWWESGSEEGCGPALVLYVLEPAGTSAAALRCLLALSAALARRLPHQLANSITYKVISIEGVRKVWGGETSAELRSLAMSVFSQSRRMLVHTNNIKSLTGFGTAAQQAYFLNAQTKDEKERAAYRLPAPVWTLSSGRVFAEEAAPCDAVLYVSYCLSADHSWLLASATDARGELLDTASINIHVPPGARKRKSVHARREGLTKLMDFILGVMSQTAQPWRLVVGRIGRIGHGELKGWSRLLSRRALTCATNTLRSRCGACGVVAGSTPSVLSACLVSTEPDSCLRLMPDRFTPDERRATHSTLHTPRDVSATHILVFPTSATTQSSQTAFQERVNGPELGDDDILFPGMGTEDMNEEMELSENINMTDLFSTEIFGGPGGWGGENTGPARPHSAASSGGSEVGAQLSQQPLALGYLVSTAPLPAMPTWWWGGGAHFSESCPAFLKSALHLHWGVQTSSDDVLLPRAHHHHALDSHYTTDVLRPSATPRPPFSSK